MSAAYIFPVALLALLVWCIYKGTVGWLRDQRLAEHIGRIGFDQKHGAVEIITEAMLSERRL